MKHTGTSAISFLLVSSLFIGCSFLIYETYKCSKDNSKVLKKVGIPMQENVLAFYKEYQRYPNLKESTKLMEKAGCKNNRQRESRESKNEKGKIYERWANYFCDFGSQTLGYGVSVGDFKLQYNATPYGFGLSKRNTRCSVDFTKVGDSRNLTCSQNSCFIKHWGH